MVRQYKRYAAINRQTAKLGTLIKIKRVFILRCLILSISFRTKHVLRICDKVVRTRSVLASVFWLLKIATNAANIGSSAIKMNLRNLVPAT